MKATYDNSFCMDHKCINYFEDTCMLCLEGTGEDVEPYNIDYIDKHGRGKSSDCKEYTPGKNIGYLVD